jgi:hypothetical protein
MDTSIIRNLALALSLSIAPIGIAVAQENPAKKPLIEEGVGAGQQMQQNETGATVEDGAAQPPQGEAGAAEAPQPEDEGGVTAQEGAAPPPDGEAGTAEAPPAEGEAGTAEAPAVEEETDATAEGEVATDEETGTADAPETEEETGATAEDRAADEPETKAAAEADVDVEVTGSIDVTEEQRTQIAQVVRDIDIEPVDVDFDINVGTAIPTTSRVALHIVPEDIVSVIPQFRNHLHFVAADDRVVIIDPCSLEIEAIIA